MAEQRGDDDADAAAAVGAAKKKKRIVLSALIVLLLALAVGGTWFALSMASGDKAGAAQTEQADAAQEEGQRGPKKASIYEPLDPAFLANFQIGGRQRYLQVSLSVMAREQDGIDAVRAHMPLIRNRVVLILSGESFEHLQTDGGRVQLQQKLLTAIQEILQKETGDPGIEQVFFTNFVLQ